MNDIGSFEIIKQVTDRYFALEEEFGFLKFPASFIPDEMKDKQQPNTSEEWQYWKPIPSSVTDEKLSELEKRIGYQLPPSYKFFIRQRHFIEVQMGNQPINFFRSTPENWVDMTYKQMNDFPPSLLELDFLPPLERGFIPFGHYMDQGWICFDTNDVPLIDCEYRTVFLDHEDGYQEPQFESRNFLALWSGFSKHLDWWENQMRVYGRITDL
jgi:hypothetical protein